MIEFISLAIISDFDKDNKKHMNEEERDTFRFDLALCLLVGIVIAFYILNILFK
jgi:hypothetical protein